MSWQSKSVLAQQQIASLLAADAFFTDPGPPPVVLIPVITEIEGDIMQAIKITLLKLGVGVAIILPLVSRADDSTPCLQMELKFAVAVTENPIINRNRTPPGPPSLAVAERIVAVLNNAPNGVDPDSLDDRMSRFVVDRNAIEHLGSPPPSADNPNADKIVIRNVAVTTWIEIIP